MIFLLKKKTCIAVSFSTHYAIIAYDIKKVNLCMSAILKTCVYDLIENEVFLIY